MRTIPTATTGIAASEPLRRPLAEEHPREQPDEDDLDVPEHGREPGADLVDGVVPEDQVGREEDACDPGVDPRLDRPRPPAPLLVEGRDPEQRQRPDAAVERAGRGRDVRDAVEDPGERDRHRADEHGDRRPAREPGETAHAASFYRKRRRRRQRRLVVSAAALDLVQDHPVGQPLDRRAVVGQRPPVRPDRREAAAKEREQARDHPRGTRGAALELGPRDGLAQREEHVVELGGPASATPAGRRSAASSRSRSRAAGRAASRPRSARSRRPAAGASARARRTPRWRGRRARTAAGRRRRRSGRSASSSARGTASRPRRSAASAGCRPPRSSAARPRSASDRARPRRSRRGDRSARRRGPSSRPRSRSRACRAARARGAAAASGRDPSSRR